MKEDSKDKENDHKDDRSWSSLDTEKPNETNDGKVGTSSGLLQSSRINKTLCVNARIGYEKKVVAVGQVYQVETDGREAKDKWCNDRIRDSCSKLAKDSVMRKMNIPMTVKLV